MISLYGLHAGVIRSHKTVSFVPPLPGREGLHLRWRNVTSSSPRIDYPEMLKV